MATDEAGTIHEARIEESGFCHDDAELVAH